MSTLECSTRGDRRFSALCAKVSAFGRIDTIESHYQTTKCLANPKTGEIIRSKSWRDVKRLQHMGYVSVRHEFRGYPGVKDGFTFPATLSKAFYYLLWVKHLDQHPELVEYARQFDSFSDVFARPGSVTQAEAVHLYVKSGREALLAECQPLIRLLLEHRRADIRVLRRLRQEARR